MLKFNDINIHEANGVTLRIRLGVVLGLRFKLCLYVFKGLWRVVPICAYVVRNLCAPRNSIVQYSKCDYKSSHIYQCVTLKLLASSRNFAWACLPASCLSIKEKRVSWHQVGRRRPTTPFYFPFPESFAHLQHSLCKQPSPYATADPWAG